MNRYYGSDGFYSRKPSFPGRVLKALQAPFSAQRSAITGIIAITVIFYLITKISDFLYFQMMFYSPLAFEQPWRFVTAALLHANLAHIFFNMCSLYLFGHEIERVLGKWNFIALYVLSVISGNFFAYTYSLWISHMGIALVGASGGIFGLFGALLVLIRQVRGNTNGILILLGINLLLGIVNPQISWQAHLGGFIGGFIYTAVFVFVLKAVNKFKRKY